MVLGLLDQLQIFSQLYLIELLGLLTSLWILKLWHLIWFCSTILFLIYGSLGCYLGKRTKKWPKMTKNCLSRFISEELYMVWLSFMVHLCKVMIFPGVFFIFSKFCFSGLLVRGGGGGRVKTSPKWEKNSVCCTPYLRNHTSYDFYLWYTCVK